MHKHATMRSLAAEGDSGPAIRGRGRPSADSSPALQTHYASIYFARKRLGLPVGEVAREHRCRPFTVRRAVRWVEGKMRADAGPRPTPVYPA